MEEAIVDTETEVDTEVTYRNSSALSKSCFRRGLTVAVPTLLVTVTVEAGQVEEEEEDKEKEAEEEETPAQAPPPLPHSPLPAPLPHPPLSPPLPHSSPLSSLQPDETLHCLMLDSIRRRRVRSGHLQTCHSMAYQELERPIRRRRRHHVFRWKVQQGLSR